MTEENVKADGRPDSRELSESLKTSAFSHRDFCAMKVKEAQEQLAHWKEQHDIITEFLANNQLQDSLVEKADDEPWFDDSDQKESPDQEMAKHVQNLRDTVRNNSGWNYGPTDLR